MRIFVPVLILLAFATCCPAYSMADTMLFADSGDSQPPADGGIADEPSGGVIEGEITSDAPGGVIEGDLTVDAVHVNEDGSLDLGDLALKEFREDYPYSPEAMGLDHLEPVDALYEMLVQEQEELNPDNPDSSCARCSTQYLYMHSTDEELMELIQALWELKNFMKLPIPGSQEEWDKRKALQQRLWQNYWDVYNPMVERGSSPPMRKALARFEPCD